MKFHVYKTSLQYSGVEYLWDEDNRPEPPIEGATLEVYDVEYRRFFVADLPETVTELLKVSGGKRFVIHPAGYPTKYPSFEIYDDYRE